MTSSSTSTVERRARRSPARPTVARPKGPSPVDLGYLDDFHPEARDYALIAAETALQYRQRALSNKPNTRNQHTKLPPSADEIVSGFIDHVAKGGWFWWKSMLNVVLDIMQADPRFYGVGDPVVEQQCVKCRIVQPLDHFRRGKIRCRKCEL